MKVVKKCFVFLAVAGLVMSCTSEKQLKESISKVIKENPDILVKAIEDNPVEFMEAVQKAAKEAQAGLAKKREEAEQKKLAESYDNPLIPKIRKDEAIRGTKGAPLVLVEYSDFECPFCTRGFNTVMELMDKYPGKIQFIYKHLPLSFHKQAKIAAQYYEAIKKQSHDKAFKFHDEVFKQQKKLRNGESFLKAIAKKVGADMGRVAKDINAKDVLAKIDEDLKEAASFGMQGTPGFLLNGVPVKGAYPTSHFVNIVEELKKRGKVKL